jgi:hypothetical protein
MSWHHLLSTIFIASAISHECSSYSIASVKKWKVPSRVSLRLSNSLSANTGIQVNDPEITHLINCEQSRQQSTLNLIASENYASKSVLEALGSIMTNKYSEGQV